MNQILSNKWQLQPLEEWSGNNSRAVLTALFIASGSLMVLAYGIGLGSSALSFALLIAPCIGLLAIGTHRHTLLDSLFILFLGCVAISTVINGLAPWKETALLVASLLAYPAARRGASANRSLFIVLVVVAAIGIAVTALTLIEQWNAPHGKPLIFGRFDAAPAQFFICIALLIFGIVAANLPTSNALMLLAATSLPLVVLGAAIVRFSFIALAATLCLEAALSKRHRVKAIAGALIVLAAGTVGQLARPEMAAKLSAVPLTIAPPSSGPVKACSEVNETSSISVRVRLLKDALHIIPKTGLWGSGLGSFAATTCMGMSPHVTIFQVVVEFGWIAAVAILVLFGGALYLTYWMERPEARFAFMSLVFVSLLTLVHGDLARSGLFFLLLGYVARLSEEPP